MTDYEQKLYDVIVDWWNQTFIANTESIDFVYDMNPTIIDLVKSINQIER